MTHGDIMSKEKWTDEDFIVLYFSLPDEQRQVMSRFITVHTKLDFNLEFAKTMINQMEGCRVCGTSYDQIVRNKS